MSNFSSNEVNFPAALAPLLQQDKLDLAWEMPLTPLLVYDEIAEEIPFPTRIGISQTYTRRSYLNPIDVTNPMGLVPNDANDLDDGVTNINEVGLEQYSVVVHQYSGGMNLNVITEGQGIVDRYMWNVTALAQQGARAADDLAQIALANAGLSGQTVVTGAVGTAGSTLLAVDDIRGFQFVYPLGIPTAVGVANPLTIAVGANNYTLVGAIANGSVGQTPWAQAGTLVVTSAISAADGSLGAAVISSIAPYISRPGNVKAWNQIGTNTITLGQYEDSVAYLRSNGVPPVSGPDYLAYVSNTSQRNLMNDTTVKSLFQMSKFETDVFGRQTFTGPVVGLKFVITTNPLPIQTVAGGFIHRSLVCGKDVLVKAVYTEQAAGSPEGGLVVKSENKGIVYAARPALGRTGAIVAQTWYTIRGYMVPTDTTTTPQILTTASNAAYKRFVVVESWSSSR